MIAQSMEEKIAAINAKVKSKKDEAVQLLEYLNVQREQARIKENEEEENLKKKGIIIGQHIPSLKSKLELDNNVLEKFDSFSSTLLVAKTLVDQNKTNFLRRTGNLPISELAESRKAQNERRRTDTVPDMPNYLIKTTSSTVRADRVTERFAETISNHTLIKTQRRELEMTSSITTNDHKKSTKRKKHVLSAPERIANEEVLKSINHKLNYLRNPRNDPAGVTRMLVKPKSHFNKNDDDNSSSIHSPSKDSHHNNDNNSYISSHINEQNHQEDQSIHTEHTNNTKKKYMKSVKMTNNPLFRPEPSTLYFTNYNIGEKYQQNITFRNISAVTRSFRILPLKNTVFTISPLKYPQNSNGSMVAPGMSVTGTITFIPTTLGDFNDELHIDTESGSVDVHIHAQREPPQLSIPSVLDVGTCLVGDAQRLSFNCLNTGGGGRFRLLTVEEYATLGLGISLLEDSIRILDTFRNIPEEDSLPSCIRVLPFTLYPTDFILMKNDSIDITIEFVPLKIGAYEEKFYMTCDNGQVRAFTLRGYSKQLNLCITEINSIEYDSTDTTVFPDLCFPPACVGHEQLQCIEVVNDTGLPVEYEWIWVDIKCENLHTQGQRQIYERERIEELRHVQMLENELNGVEHIPHVDIDEHQQDRGHTAENATAKRELLKNLHVTLDGSNDRINTAEAVSNRAVGGLNDIFEITPARGVLPCEGAEKFEIRFNPSDLSTSSMRAVMMIKSAPIAALPCLSQGGYLEKLQHEGHGAYVRARSWLEEMGMPGAVDEYVKPSGALSTTKNLINLQTLVHLVVSQVMGDEASGIDDYEFRRVSKWVRQLLQHSDASRCAGDTMSVDDNSSVGNASVASSVAASVDGVTLYIECYDWVPLSTTTDSSEQDAPQLLPPYRVSRVVDPVPEMYSEEENETNQEEEAPPPAPTLREFHPSERAVMAEVWVDVSNAVLLLGDAICSVLDSKVKHEAVDYLKECSLNHLAVLKVAVYGEGKTQVLRVDPPILEFGGTLPLGQATPGSFIIRNPTDTTAEIELDLPRLTIETLFSQYASEGYDETLSQANILNLAELITFIPEYERILVMPQSEVSVQFSMSIFNTGKYRIFLPLISKSPYTIIDNVTIITEISGGRLRFNDAEIDIGLVSVGGEGSKAITFTNESDIPAMFIMKPQLHVDINAGGKKENSQHLEHENKSLNSQRSNLSRMSSARSDDFSVGGESNASNATSTDFKIELKNAIVNIEPSNGIILPHTTYSVNIICKAGKIPQRIRGLIECRVYDNTGKIEILSHYLNLRGEVQAPKTKMYPLTTNLGLVYVGRPVQFIVSIENMCNLPTLYKLSRPGGDSSLYKLTFDRYKGPLEAKEKIDVVCTFTAVATGMIDDILSNKVFGAAVPLAFVVKALSKGILLEFRHLPDGTLPPAPLAAPTETQYPGNGKPPDPLPIEPLVIGNDVPLYQRRTISFVIRNFSAIPAKFTIHPKKFKVIEKLKRWASTASVASTTTAATAIHRDDLILAPHETGTNKFKSDAGKEYIGFTVQKQEDRKFLHSGLGASYLLDVTEGCLDPWAVQVVTIRAFNDIPGCYDDEIEVLVTEGTVTHTHCIPITMSVLGCPIVIEKDTVGMTTVQKGGPAQPGKQLLQLGHACINSEPLVREFYVKNHGSKNGKVKWQVKSLTSKSNGPVKFSLQLDKDKRIHPIFQFWEDIAKDSPFRIEPEGATIPPYGKQLFKVTLFRTNQVGKELAELTGAVLFSDNVASAPNSVMGEGDHHDDYSVSSIPAETTHAAAAVNQQSNANLALSASTSKNLLPTTTASNKFTLSLVLEGDFMNPTLRIDRNEFAATSTSTTVSDQYALNMKALATVLFAKDTKSVDYCHKSVSITNPTESRLLFNVSTEGPYTIKDNNSNSNTTSSNNSQIVSKSVTHTAATAAAGGSSSNSVVSISKSSIGKTFHLLPNVRSLIHTYCICLCIYVLVVLYIYMYVYCTRCVYIFLFYIIYLL